MPETELFMEISSLTTEMKNPISENIDIASTTEILQIINGQDKLVALAVEKEISNITKAVDLITEAFRQGGRLFFAGSGTSGRFGVVDASECPPTFGTPPDMVQGIIAGGKEAMFQAQEGAEDKPENGADEIVNRNIKPPDILCCVAASGRTPFVKGALFEANKRGIKTIFITTATPEKVKDLGIFADIIIAPQVGPEVIAGSTRMKSGTAQKLILNMLTTASMIKLGKTYGNVMVDLQLTNKKLKERAKKIIMEITGIGYDDAVKYIELSRGHVKTALVMILAGVDFENAISRLEKTGGVVKKAVDNSMF